jgi:hypothetical protein
MGSFLARYGDDAYDHEGYVAQVFDDGSLTGTCSNDTTPRMIGQVVAACDCGWTGSTRYPCPGSLTRRWKESHFTTEAAALADEAMTAAEYVYDPATGAHDCARSVAGSTGPIGSSGPGWDQWHCGRGHRNHRTISGNEPGMRNSWIPAR